MIKVNDNILELNHFPDGTLHLAPGYVTAINKIIWNYEREEELLALIYITRYINDFQKQFDCKISNHLYMPYIPNARMDRVKNKKDVFTLKYFADIINSLGFDRVYVLDPHSSVSEALINNLIKIDLKEIIEPVLASVKIFAETEDIIIYFPDNGAAKKYEDLFKGYKTCYGVKHRCWETGKIEGLEVISNGIDLKDKTVIMFDDIISYGGSMYYGALKLKELGVKNIFAWASHVENSILDKEKGTLIKLLENGTVERLFTTNSLFTGEHEKIEIIKFLYLKRIIDSLRS